MNSPVLALLFAVLPVAALAADDPSVASFLETHCLRCHGEKKQKGQFRMDTLSRDFSDLKTAETWAEVMTRINAGEMPPEEEKQPSASELGTLVTWLSNRLKEGEAVRMAKRSPVSLYRLSREEYANTVYDLLGAWYDVDAPGAFNEDPRWHGFDRIGSMLSLSPSHVDRYFKAAETVLERAFPEKPVAVAKGRSAANEAKGKGEPKEGQRWLLFPSQTKANFRVTTPGLYRLRIQLSALPSFKGRLPHLALWHSVTKRSFAGRDVVAPEDQPTTIEFETFLPEGNVELTNEAPGKLDDGFTGRVSNVPFTNTKAARLVPPFHYKLFDEQDRAIFPLLIVDSVEWEGPILTDADRQKTEGLMPTSPKEARGCLQRFATRAWRRPVAEPELERFMKVVQNEVAAGETFRSAYLAALVGVLTAKNFYYLGEGSATQRRDQVNDWELASRLSYFLWGSMPDDALFAAAQSGRLHEPEILRAQVARMLADAKIKRFTGTFPQQWLQLHRVGMFPPDPELYPDYDKWLEQSMVLEAVGYFTEVFSKNLSLREFLASDWTMLNARLAMHYGLPAPKDSALQRVALRPGEHRGGLLTQAGVLMLTSDGTRHRPVHRGVWVSEAIFGRTPPPPPPNVEPLEPTPANKPKTTVRAQLEAHATNANCAACHAKIDPLGFAFDNYDALGRWRTEEILKTGQGDNPPVNASGALADGRKYAGPEEFKQLLVRDLDRFGEAFVEQLATFALRRAMTIDDAAQIKAIARACQPDGYRVRTIIERFAESELFQKR